MARSATHLWLHSTGIRGYICYRLQRLQVNGGVHVLLACTQPSCKLQCRPCGVQQPQFLSRSRSDTAPHLMHLRLRTRLPADEGPLSQCRREHPSCETPIIMLAGTHALHGQDTAGCHGSGTGWLDSATPVAPLVPEAPVAPAHTWDCEHEHATGAGFAEMQKSCSSTILHRRYLWASVAVAMCNARSPDAPVAPEAPVAPACSVTLSETHA